MRPAVYDVTCATRRSSNVTRPLATSSDADAAMDTRDVLTLAITRSVGERDIEAVAGSIRALSATCDAAADDCCTGRRTSFIPQIGQLPGSLDVTVGCIGQKYVTTPAEAASGAESRRCMTTTATTAMTTTRTAAAR